MLKGFNEATNNLSGIYYPTNLFIIESINIVTTFSECATDEQLCPRIDVMKLKWLDYYRYFSSIYLPALCFDPRCKVDSLNDYLKCYYECLGLEEEVDVGSYCTKIKSLFYQLYDEYLRIYGPSLNIDVSQMKLHLMLLYPPH